MNIVYGGAFNPLTVAHVLIVNKILETFKDANVIIVPVGNDYKKAELIDFKYRYEMIKKEFNNNSRVIVSDIENLNKFNGTIQTLDLLSKNYSNLMLLVGSDNILSFDKWIEYEKLLNKYQLLIVNRNNIDVNHEMNKYQHLDVKYKEIDFNSDVNSTLIRGDINKYKNWLPVSVYEYIMENKLYGVDINV